MSVEAAGAPGVRRIALLLLAATSLLFFWRLGDRAVISEELRWAEIAREMRTSGDYFTASRLFLNYMELAGDPSLRLL